MVFVHLPDFSHLCCVTLTLQEVEEELRSQQMKTCRWMDPPAPHVSPEIFGILLLQMFCDAEVKCIVGR